MSPQMITEPGYTKFNLTYPLATGDDTSTTDFNGGDEAIPNALVGILIPHVVCTLIILARIYSRLFLLRKWFLDDTLILLAWAFTTAVCIIYSIAAQTQQPPYGDLKLITTAATTIIPTTTRAYTSLILYQLSLLLTKFSILSFYHRIFSPSPHNQNHQNHAQTHPLSKRLTHLTTLLLPLLTLPLLTLTLLQCHPHPHPTPQTLSNNNRPSPSSTHCTPLRPLLISSAALHAAVDAWLVALILPCVARLRDVPRRRKVVLGVVLSLPGVGVLIGG
ncbi:hypothetical protein B0I37DRAFT_356769 [Chaetomium sp. MPI-CAGE-AT-0009]|nr:hypothetical protein B0I37DRAFT_356769 [Chaetomium sp. MPI-CAGE-AT-0009]